MQIMNTSNCDVSNIFSGGGPADAGAFVEIAGFQLIPSPFISLNIEKYKMGDLTIGGVLKLNLSGTVVGNSFNDVVSGLNDILDLGKDSGCVHVIVKCTNEFIDGYGRIISISSNEGNQPTWVNMAPYSIEIELYTDRLDGSVKAVNPDNIGETSISNLMLKNISENFSYSINDDTYNWGVPASGCYNLSDIDIDGFGSRHIKLNFNISAAGIPGCSGVTDSYLYGLEAAEQYIKDRLTTYTNLKDISPSYDDPVDEIIVANSDYLGGDTYMDFRTISINPVENSIEVSGEIIFRPVGCKDSNVFTSLTIEQQLTTDGETIVLSGSINGLANNSYNNIIALTNNHWVSSCSYNERLTNAEAFLAKINNPTVLSEIAQCYYSKNNGGKGFLEDNCEYNGSYDDCTTQVTPVPAPEPELCDIRLTNSTITRNISVGEINFNFTLSNAANCEVLGAKKVNVEITHDIPHDNIVEIVIPGRGSKGVLIQNLCCNSAEKYDINVDATLNRKTCSFSMKQQTINELRACAMKALEDLSNSQGIDVSCWFKTNDQESVGNTTYKLLRTYVKPSCP